MPEPTGDLLAELFRVYPDAMILELTSPVAKRLIDAGQVNVQIGICPVKPAEFVIFSIGQWDGGALIEE